MLSNEPCPRERSSRSLPFRSGRAHSLVPLQKGFALCRCPVSQKRTASLWSADLPDASLRGPLVACTLFGPTTYCGMWVVRLGIITVALGPPCAFQANLCKRCLLCRKNSDLGNPQRAAQTHASFRPRRNDLEFVMGSERKFCFMRRPRTEMHIHAEYRN